VGRIHYQLHLISVQLQVVSAREARYSYGKVEIIYLFSFFFFGFTCGHLVGGGYPRLTSRLLKSTKLLSILVVGRSSLSDPLSPVAEVLVMDAVDSGFACIITM